MANIEREMTLKVKLDELNSERLLVKSQLDRERLTTITSNLIETITSPVNFNDAAELMSLESLRAAGAEIPDDFRLTSRVFEDSTTGIKIEIKPPKMAIDLGNTLAWGACAGGGAATVCGCAGGST